MSDTTTAKKTILLGICGGVAAYKAVDVASSLRKLGYNVHVAMTDAAQRFVVPRTFALASGNPVLDKLFPPEEATGEEAFPHLYPATRADLFVLLPATANTLGKIAQGRGDDVVSTSALSLPPHCIRVFCPAMNVEMWQQESVRESVRVLEQRGWLRIGPDSGALACGMTGEGRMSEPEEIVEQARALLAASHTLAGRRILILSGPTREHLDPVRFISNPSSGKMGRALAQAAVAAGAEVTFISGPVSDENLPRGNSITIHPVISADEMLAEAKRHYSEADIAIYAAAVSDYRPANYHDKKLPKENEALSLPLEPTSDIAATINANKRPGQIAIGFALQTHDGPAKAAEKLQRKHFDGIVLNALDALGGESGSYTWIEQNKSPDHWGALPKTTCAHRILAQAVELLKRG